jgi:hypothetical protein
MYIIDAAVTGRAIMLLLIILTRRGVIITTPLSLIISRLFARVGYLHRWTGYCLINAFIAHTPTLSIATGSFQCRALHYTRRPRDTFHIDREFQLSLFSIEFSGLSHILPRRFHFGSQNALLIGDSLILTSAAASLTSMGREFYYYQIRRRIKSFLSVLADTPHHSAPLYILSRYYK